MEQGATALIEIPVLKPATMQAPVKRESRPADLAAALLTILLSVSALGAASFLLSRRLPPAADTRYRPPKRPAAVAAEGVPRYGGDLSHLPMTESVAGQSLTAIQVIPEATGPQTKPSAAESPSEGLPEAPPSPPTQALNPLGTAVTDVGARMISDILEAPNPRRLGSGLPHPALSGGAGLAGGVARPFDPLK